MKGIKTFTFKKIFKNPFQEKSIGSYFYSSEFEPFSI